MKRLFDVLPDMATIAKQRESQTETSSAGSETLTTKTATTMSLPSLQDRSNQLPAAKHTENNAAAPLPKQPQTSVLSSQETLQLLSFLDTSFAVLDTYGRKPDQLTEISKIFVEMLKGYTFEKIKQGFMQHMKRSSRMPTPADIINLIDPPPPPPWKPDWAYYVAIQESKKRGNFISTFSDEYTYLKRCEQWSIDNLKNWDAYEESREEIARISSRIAIEDHGED